MTAADIIKVAEQMKPARSSCTLEEWMCNDGPLKQLLCEKPKPANVVLKVDLSSDCGFSEADIGSVIVNGVEFIRKP